MDVGRATSQANKISDYASTVREIRNKLNNFLTNLNHQWQAEEMVHINNAVNNMSNELSRLSSSLESLGPDIINTAWEIKREEEARAAAARARAKK